MRIDFGLILAIAVEYVLFIYYADTLFDRKRPAYLCRTITAIGYIAHFVVCVFGNATANTLTFGIVNFICFMLCYAVSAKKAAFQSVLLMVLSSASEWILVAVPFLGIGTDLTEMTPLQSIILTLASKMLYATAIMFVSKLLIKTKDVNMTVSPAITVIPVITCAAIIALLHSNPRSAEFFCVALALFSINIIIFIVNQRMTRQEIENERLKKELLKAAAAAKKRRYL